MIGRRQDQCVLTRKKKRLSFTGCSTNRELVTVLIVINGGGTVILPMAMLPGKVYEEHWYLTTSSKDDCLEAVSERGFQMTNEPYAGLPISNGSQCYMRREHTVYSYSMVICPTRTVSL